MPGSAETSETDAFVNGNSGLAKELNAYTISDAENIQSLLYRNRATHCVTSFSEAQSPKEFWSLSSKVAKWHCGYRVHCVRITQLPQCCWCSYR